MPKKPEVAMVRSFRNNSQLMIDMCRNLEYKSSEELYQDPEAYKYFIGSEIMSNAVFAAQITEKLVKSGMPMQKVPTVVETAAGTGASILKIDTVLPNARRICVEISEELCKQGEKDHPGIEYIAEDMIEFKFRPGTVDLVFNSASSLGFLDIEQLSEHIKNVGKSLTKNGRYFADVGFYSCPQAAYLNWIYMFKTVHDAHKGKFARRVLEPTMTLRYYPVSDTHDIAYSTWHAKMDTQVATHVDGYVHNLRAYRFSEIAFLAKLHGLKARLWKYEEKRTSDMADDWVGDFEFTLMTQDSFIEKVDDASSMVIEIYKDGDQYLIGEL